MGGFGGGHMGGFGGGHTGGFGGSHLGWWVRWGACRWSWGDGLGIGTVHVVRPRSQALGCILAGPDFTSTTVWFGDYAWGPRCDYGTDYVMADPDCRLPY
jgi:hypothetical protein